MKNNVTRDNSTLARKKIVSNLIALNPNISSSKIAKELNIHVDTVQKYRSDPKVIDMIYDRFMEVAGIHLPEILMAQIEEAKRGNTRAAELILKHFGKLHDVLVLKVESPFMQHLKVSDTEEAEIVEDMAVEIGESFEIKDQDKLPPLPERDPINDTPLSKVIKDNKDYESTYIAIKKRAAANARKKLRNRAKKVKLKLLPSSRPTPEVRRKWLDELHKRETKLLQKK